MNLSAGVLNAWIQVWFIYGIFSALEQGSTPRILIGRLLLFLCICLLQRALYSVWSELLLPSSNVRLYEFFDHRIYDKACRLPFRRLEDPAFYDLYARTREFVDRDLIKAWSNISALSGFIGSVLVSSSFLVQVSIPAFIFVLIGLFPLTLLNTYKKELYALDKEQTASRRYQEYIRRVFFRKDYAKELRTTKVSGLLLVKLKETYHKNLEVIDRHAGRLVGLHFCQALGSVDMIYVMIMIYGFLRVCVLNDLDVPGFSVLFSSVVLVTSRLRKIVERLQLAQLYGMKLEDHRRFLSEEEEHSGQVPMWARIRSLSFQGVSFRYGDETAPALDDISFSIHAGEKVAIVGTNGSGKSTLFGLIAGLYEPTTGDIRINGTPIRDFSPDEYHTRVGMILQAPPVFDTTILNNLLPAASTDESVLRKRAELLLKRLRLTGPVQKAMADKSILDIPLGGEALPGGNGLSGGEKQKLEIARVLAQEPELILADEPTSAMDPVMEEELFNLLFEASSDKLLIYATHRMSAALRADRVIVLSDGRISDSGTPQELLSRDGMFRTLFLAQRSQYED